MISGLLFQVVYVQIMLELRLLFFFHLRSWITCLDRYLRFYTRCPVGPMIQETLKRLGARRVGVWVIKHYRAKDASLKSVSVTGYEWFGCDRRIKAIMTGAASVQYSY